MASEARHQLQPAGSRVTVSRTPTCGSLVMCVVIMVLSTVVVA